MNSTATFMNMMNRNFKKYLDKFENVFISDILRYSKMEEEHTDHLRITLEFYEKRYCAQSFLSASFG